MDTLTEDYAQSDVDTEMYVLTPEDVPEQELDASDDVESLRNSLREAVHDDNVQPKLHCLMMDSSFSMVTMQGEDSGIAWETTPSRCNTPWASDAGIPSTEVSSFGGVRPATPSSQPAGKIIFVMDEELLSRRKKTNASGQRSRTERQKSVLAESSESICGRPELVEFSQPNVKNEDEGNEDQLADASSDKEQRLFSLVSEGSEILNIIVPPKLATVDEEESKDMVDNLSYLEESPAPKANEDTLDQVFDLYETIGSPTVFGSEGRDHIQPSPPVVCSDCMDPPGAPVARPPGRGTATNVDYFEAFSLIDPQAPGSPAVITDGQVEAEAEAEEPSQGQDSERPELSEDHTGTSVDNEKSDTISLGEITSKLLDEVFYSGTENLLSKDHLDREDGCSVVRPSRLPVKPSGSTLFGSQEDVLTPIFLPEGPPKIIDPILLEEPKAMAFLYTDLYEEAIGNRNKEEDTESMTSEKSFHSRHSDNEARGYLEKYVLIDETPTVEAKPLDKENHQEEGPRILSRDLYYACDLLSEPQNVKMPDSEEEITDFFRSSANSSPCDLEPFPRSQEDDEAESVKPSKTETNKSVTLLDPKLPEQQCISDLDISPEEHDWEDTDDHMGFEVKDVMLFTNQEVLRKDVETHNIVAPPRKKASSSPKSCLDLTPLTPVDVIMDEAMDETGAKEQREEEKETASPAETADEGDREEASYKVPLHENESTEPSQTKSVKDCNETAEDTKPALSEERDTGTAENEEKSNTEEASEQTELDANLSESVKSEINLEKQEDTSTISTSETNKNKGHCIIL